MIIGISGRIGSGKDETGRIIQELTKNKVHHRWEIKKFATKLKQIVSILTGIPVEELEKHHIKDSFLPSEWQTEHKTYTYREFLQKIGTEAFRDIIHENTWVNALFSEYRRMDLWENNDTIVNDYDYRMSVLGKLEMEEYKKLPESEWIITDVRFPNEVNRIKYFNGVIIRINRPGIILNDHPSETLLDDYSFDYVIDNDEGKDKLITNVANMLKIFKFI